MEISQTGPTDHINSLPSDVRSDIELLDAEITKRMPGQTRVLWEGRFWGGSDQQIIGYGDFTYTNAGGKTVEWFMVGLANQKSYISMYVNAANDDGYLLSEYKDRLGKAKIGSASISFKSIDQIDMDALMELVEAAAQQVP